MAGAVPQFQGCSHHNVSFLDVSFHSCINTKAILNTGRVLRDPAGFSSVFFQSRVCFVLAAGNSFSLRFEKCRDAVGSDVVRKSSYGVFGSFISLKYFPPSCEESKSKKEKQNRTTTTTKSGTVKRENNEEPENLL